MVTGRYVKFSLSDTLARRDEWLGRTLLTRRPPGFRCAGMRSIRAEFTASVSESFCGVSLGGAVYLVFTALRLRRLLPVLEDFFL